jgi:hypothetical protein
MGLKKTMVLLCSVEKAIGGQSIHGILQTETSTIAVGSFPMFQIFLIT